MPYRSLHSSVPSPSPALSTGEWRDVQRAMRAVQDSTCPRGERPGPWRRGLARIGQIVPVLRTRPAPDVPAELEPLRNFLCESARHGPAVGELAAALERQGYSSAQIAAMTLIVG